MGYKFNAEILNGYKSRKNKSEATFEYGQGVIKINHIEIAEFDEIEIHIQPIIKKVSLMNSNGDDKVAIGYHISANLNISKEFSRYKKIDIDSQLDIEISEGISISECKIKNIDENNMILQNVRIENIEMI